MTKNLLSSLLVGAAITLVSTPTFAQAQECVWADSKIYGKYDVSKPIPAETVVSGLYKHKKYSPYHKYCTYDQFKAQFFAQNGGAVDAYDRGSVLLVPVPVRLDEAAPAPAPTPTPSAQPRGGVMIDDRIDRIEARLANGGYNPDQIAAMQAEIEALRAAQAASSATQTTRVVEKPIYTTKTVQVGLSAADKQRLDGLQTQIDTINGKPQLTEVDRKLLDGLENEKTSLLKSLERRMNSLTGDGTKKNPDGRVGRIEKRLDALDGWDPRAWSLRDLVVALLALVAFIVAVLALFRPRTVTKLVRADRLERNVDEVRDNVVRGFKIDIPADLEADLNKLPKGRVHEVNATTALGGDYWLYFRKVGRSKVEQVKAYLDEPQPMHISALRRTLIRHLLAETVSDEPRWTDAQWAQQDPEPAPKADA